MRSKNMVNSIMNIRNVSQEEAEKIESTIVKVCGGVKVTSRESINLMKTFAECAKIVRRAKDQIAEIDRLKKDVEHQKNIMRTFGFDRA